ncbi:MAG: DUF3883 domain-containing protein [Oscillospiraceae bacterium]|nr:DUF3883 domain-containing protein [Oscillospiraceae bacterium]
MNKSQLFIKRLNDDYISKHTQKHVFDDLIVEYNTVKKDIKGYHGREILELLQNADDAYENSVREGRKPDNDLEVNIEFIENVLTVENTGTFFSEDGIKAIVQGNNSDKAGSGYIGNKGTGFRSILNWAEQIFIHSGEFNIEFSKEIAKKAFKGIENHPQIQKQIKQQKEKGKKLYIPMLAYPQYIENSKWSETTVIKVVVNQKKQSDGYGVSKQINDIDLKILLFLPNIRKISIHTDVDDIIYEKLQTGYKKPEKVFLSKITDGDMEKEESYYYFSKILPKAIKEDEDDEDKKDVRLAVAIPLDYSRFENCRLYSFFPLLETESPFNCVLNATYVLGDQRNNLSPTEVNTFIIREQLRFLIETAKDMAEIEANDVPLRLLTPVNFEYDRKGISHYPKRGEWKFLSAFSISKLENEYLDMLKKKDVRVFLTVNNEYISICDKPKILNKGCPEFFKGKEFSNLLKPLNGKELDLLYCLSERTGNAVEYNEHELLAIVNNLTETWTKEQRVEVFTWWNENFENTLPSLLKTQAGDWLVFGNEYSFLTETVDDEGLPNWVKVPTLESSYQKLLFEIAGQNADVIKIKETEKSQEDGRSSPIDRIISQNNIYPLVDFKYRDKSTIVTAVNSSVDNYEKSVEFVKWLWKYYSSDEKWEPIDKVIYKFPNDTEPEGYQDSRRMFFGSEYGYGLSEKLFAFPYCKFPGCDVFIDNPDPDTILRFQCFVELFGVRKFPPVELTENVKPIRQYSEEYERSIASLENVESSDGYDISYTLKTIDKITEILQALTTESIIKWISSDSNLKAWLKNSPYEDNAIITYKRKKRGSTTKTYYEKKKNYLLCVFNNRKWVNLNGKRYRPAEVLKSIDSDRNQLFSPLVPVLGTEIIESWAINTKIDYEEIVSIIELFDFCEKVTNLSSDDFYGLLLKLPDPEYDFQKSQKISKAIYRIIEQPGFSRIYEDSKNKKQYFTDGKILVRYKGELKYWFAREAYLPSTRIVVKKDVRIVEKNQRQASKIFTEIFGCRQYDGDYDIDEGSIKLSDCNERFAEFFKEFSKFANAYAVYNANLEKNLGKLSVKLVKEIIVTENNGLKRIEDEYVLLRKSPTIWYITVFSQNYDINELSLQIENIYSNIADTPGFDSGKIGELFRTPDKAVREFLILKEFDTLDVISDEIYESANQKRINFVETIKKLQPDYTVEDCCIDFNRFNFVSSAVDIISTLRVIDCDVDEFSDAGFNYSINLIPYYNRQLSEYITGEKLRYKDFLFTKALNDPELQLGFIESAEDFEYFEIAGYENSIYFDVKQKVIDEFGLWDIDDPEDSDEAYSINYEIMNPEDLYGDEISNNKTAQTMIYFGDEQGFSKWLIEQEKIERESNKMRKEKDHYAELRGVVPEKEDLVFNAPTKPEAEIRSKRKGAYNQKYDEQTKRAKKVYGNKGELLIHALLSNDPAVKKVIPRSEAFVALGILKPGQAVSGDYDLSYIDELGDEYFVEVKTGDGMSFIITPGELEFAKKHPENYKLFLVYNLDKSPPNYTELPARFWEDKKFRRNDIVEKIEFSFDVTRNQDG